MVTPRGVTFTRDSARRIAAAVREVEALPGDNGFVRRQRRSPPARPVQVLHVTSATPDGTTGYYPAAWLVWEGTAYTDQGSVWALPPVGGSLTVGYYGGMSVSATADNVPVFQAWPLAGGAGGVGITVADVSA